MFIVLASTPKWFAAWPAIACAIGIFWLSVVKTPSIRLSDHWFWDNIDKPEHALAYGIFCYLVCRAYRKVFNQTKLSKLTIRRLAALVFSYGLSIEFLQYFLPHRSFDPFDLIANAIGIALGAAIFARNDR